MRTYVLGTNVKINASLSLDPDTITITVKNETGQVMVADANMTKELDTLYSYNYQSQETDAVGIYTATVKAGDSSRTVVKYIEFSMTEQP